MSDHIRSNRSNSIPELPSLGSGLQLLEVDGEPRGPLHTLAVDQILTSQGSAYWVDTGGHATTQPLARIAPDPRVLDRIQVARGFTPFQHYTLIDELCRKIGEETALVVVPALDRFYRENDLRQDEGEAMLVRVLAMLAQCGREHDIPILVTRSRDDEFAAPVEASAATTIECQSTTQGPRFVADEFETLVYPASHGQLQTTLAFWHRILDAREPLYEQAPGPVAPSSPEVVVDGAN
ncbi:hypothetical protein [Saliphagus infecundisoli]|uniref:DNA recombination and repair protein Rad51-like C-terminal domain-containing protein n=1 Tax=Saliphagus infecundisoli TaxID=1849069 RepID=A0ABD5QH09_9EURY|nr:hypothetical protein [Saliphagus infecundisoli]